MVAPRFVLSVEFQGRIDDLYGSWKGHVHETMRMIVEMMCQTRVWPEKLSLTSMDDGIGEERTRWRGAENASGRSAEIQGQQHFLGRRHFLACNHTVIVSCHLSGDCVPLYMKDSLSVVNRANVSSLGPSIVKFTSIAFHLISEDRPSLRTALAGTFSIFYVFGKNQAPGKSIQLRFTCGNTEIHSYRVQTLQHNGDAR